MIRVDRQSAIREIGAAIRAKTQEFEKSKHRMVTDLGKTRKKALKAVEVRAKELRKATTLEDISRLVREDLLSWKETKDFPSTPTLNVCREKEFLAMLQRDVRKVMPINSNHEIWGILKGKCEVISA
jgi:hypothetical protein